MSEHLTSTRAFYCTSGTRIIPILEEELNHRRIKRLVTGHWEMKVVLMPVDCFDLSESGYVWLLVSF